MTSTTDQRRRERAGMSELTPCRECAAVSAAIGTVEFMDPPDGGDVSLSEQVRRMRSALDAARASSGEVVAWRWRTGPNAVWNYQEDRQRIAGAEHQPLYASPVSGEVEEALRLAYQTFSEYADLHRAKGTRDGDEKAARNAALAQKMAAALSEQGEK